MQCTCEECVYFQLAPNLHEGECIDPAKLIYPVNGRQPANGAPIVRLDDRCSNWRGVSGIALRRSSE